MFCCEKTQWFAMRVTYRRELDVKNLLDQQGVSSFIPMHYVIRMAKKRKVRELVPVVHNLIFIHITQTDMKELKKDIPYLQYMTDSRSGEKIIVPDGQMRDFIAVASICFFSNRRKSIRLKEHGCASSGETLRGMKVSL